jgi:hypothetical protein
MALFAKLHLGEERTEGGALLRIQKGTAKLLAAVASTDPPGTREEK